MKNLVIFLNQKKIRTNQNVRILKNNYNLYYSLVLMIDVAVPKISY